MVNRALESLALAASSVSGPLYSLPVVPPIEVASVASVSGLSYAPDALESRLL